MKKNKIIDFFVVAFVLSFYGGFLCHSCKDAFIFGRYSLRYTAFLLIFFFIALALFFILKKTCYYFIKNKWKGLGQVILAAVFISFLIEGLYHVLGPIAGKIRFQKIYSSRTAHPFLTYTNRRVNNPAQGINRYGFYGKELLMPKPKNELRIFALGGSTTECNRKEPWTEELEKILSETGGKKTVRVYNLGVAGWSTAHSIINYLFYARDFEPDIVIFYHAWNDFYRSFYNKNNRINSEFFNDYSHYIEGKVYWKEFFPYSTRHQLAIGHIKEFLNRYWYSDFLAHKLTPADNFDIPSLNIFKRNLQIAAGLFKRDGCTAIFITQPNLYKPEMTKEEEGVCWTNKVFFVSKDGSHYASNKFLFEGTRQFNEIIREAARENNVILVDLAERLPQTLEFFIDDIHLTAKGNKLLAGYLKETIAKIW